MMIIKRGSPYKMKLKSTQNLLQHGLSFWNNWHNRVTLLNLKRICEKRVFNQVKSSRIEVKAGHFTTVLSSLSYFSFIHIRISLLLSYVCFLQLVMQLSLSSKSLILTRSGSVEVLFKFPSIYGFGKWKNSIKR